ncbi:MAG: beta strand repeat-containing protein, partial [Rubripirellula sp.]
TAAAAGFESGTGSVTVNDVDSPTLTLSIAETEVAEDGVVTATISRNTDVSSALQVEVESSDATAATVPTFVTIAAGQSSVTFEVSGVDDSVVDGDKVAVVSAAVNGFVAGTDSIIVVDNDIAAITLLIAEESISEAGGASVATLSRNTLTSSSLTVVLTNSDASEITIPQDVTIPVGASSVTFTMDAVDDSEYDGNQNVVITASSNGFVSGVDSLQVLDDDPPPATPEILFVDDDQGASYERFYTSALDANSLQYDSWQVSSQGLPGTADLSDYDVVIWNTGFEYSATGSGLATAEQTALSGYLDGGGGLFLVGQDILYNGVSASFQSDYLKLASFTSDVRNLSQYVGVSGSSISDGMNLTFSLPSDFSADWSDSLAPASGAEGVFYRNSVNSDAQPFNTIGYGGEDFRMVFMAAPFEGISSSAGDPNNQAFVMDKVVDFLMPPVTATGDVVVSSPSPSSVTTEAGGSVSFTVVLTEAPVSDVSFSVESSDASEGTVDVSQLTFTPGNWDSAQAVTVTGVDDSVVDGDVGYSIVLGVAGTTDSNYSGLNPDDVSLSNTDNDIASLSLDLGTASVSEGSTLVGVVTRNTDTGSPLTVNLSSGDPSEASVSGAVTIPAGSSSAEFVIAGVDDSFVDGDQQVSITVSSSGYTGASGDVTVVDTTAAALSLSLADAAISESGGETTGTVTRNSTGDAVSLTIVSSDESEVKVGTLTILAGETSGTFSVIAQDDSLVDGDQAVTVSVDATGYSGDSASLTVTDDEVALLTLSIPSPAVDEGSSTTGTITRNTVASGALVVNLESSDSGEASVSSSVTIPDGQSSVSFTINGIQDDFVDGSQVATITAAAAGFESGTGSVTVNDVDSPTLTLSIAETEVAEDGVVTATVSRNTDSDSSLLVTLFSSDSGEAAVAQDVVIQSGSLSASFSVSGQLDGEVDGTQSVTVTATATGFAGGSDSIEVTDIDSETNDLFYFSRKNNGTVAGVLFQNEDIVAYNGSEFRVFFDGTPWASGLTLDAFSILDNGDILMSYSVAGSITGGSLSFDDSDILRFSPATQTWALYFDGSDVGLSSNGEDVDSIGFAPDGRLVISTSGSNSANGVSSRDEDMIVFNQTSLGVNTAGSFEMYFDGSDVGLSTSSSEDVDAVSITSDGTIYVSTVGNFSVTGTSGADEDVFVFEPANLGASTSGTFRSGLYFDGSAYGFGNDVGGLHVVDPPASGSGAAAAVPGLGEAAPDGLMVIMNIEPVVPVEVLGPMTFAQWQSLSSSELVLAPTSEASQTVDEGKAENASDDELHVMCLDAAFSEWGI